MKICILLPVLNEVTNIVELITRIENALINQIYIICIIDDGSKDGTLNLLHKFVKEQRNIHLIQRVKVAYGSMRGGALYDGLVWSLQNDDYDIFVEMDGDLSHRPEELLKGINIIRQNNADVAIASKYLKGSQVTSRPWGRLIISRLCNMALQCLFSFKITDYSNGYRFYNRNSAELITKSPIRYYSPIYLTEVMTRWLLYSCRIQEFSTHYVGRNEGLSKLRIIDLIKAGVAVFHLAMLYYYFKFRLKITTESK